MKEAKKGEEGEEAGDEDILQGWGSEWKKEGVVNLGWGGGGAQ